MITIAKNHKVLWDSYAGLIKAKYIGLHDSDSAIIQITSNKNPVYKHNEIICTHLLHVIPCECYHKTGIFRYTVYPEYKFI